jgi:aminoglycoside 2'-N-acetyltransferase I
MSDPRLLHSAFLTQAERTALRDLLTQVFPEDSTDDNLDHAFGGMHAMVWESGELVAHASVVMRRLLHDGAPLRTGYVEAVAVRADRRRQGLGNAVMASLETVIRGAYEIGALSSSDAGISLYEKRGWLRWQGTASAMTPTGIVRTEGEEDGIFVLPVTAELNLAGDLACDWRSGDVW